MEAKTARKILTHKVPARLYDVVEPVLQDAELRHALVENSFHKNETLRYNSVRVLFRALDTQPELFYPYWDRFAEMIVSVNGFHRAAAGQAIAFLAAVDTDCRIDKLFIHYLRLLDDPKVMVAHYFIDTLDRVCRARPDLQPKVMKALFNFEETKHLPARKELLKATILGVFDRLFDSLTVKDQKKALSFAEACVSSSSGKTKKAAKVFLTKRRGGA